jgi:hypothetical protein
MMRDFNKFNSKEVLLLDAMAASIDNLVAEAREVAEARKMPVAFFFQNHIFVVVHPTNSVAGVIQQVHKRQQTNLLGIIDDPEI